MEVDPYAFDHDSGGHVSGGSAESEDLRTPAHTLLFGPSGSRPPDSWRMQGFSFAEGDDNMIGIVQHVNGPCGVLAAVNAEVVLRMGLPSPNTSVPDSELAATIAAIVLRCARATGPDQPVTVARWQGEAPPAADGVGIGPALPQDEVAVTAAVMENMAAFRGPGGCVLLCHSVVYSRGVDGVRADVAADGGELPLVYGPHALCSSELVNLILEGVARGNVSAYDPTGAKSDWRARISDGRSGVGMLSRAEIDSDVPLADELKSPAAPVYLVHGGDHFTFMWAARPDDDDGRSGEGGGGGGGGGISDAIAAVLGADAVLWHHWNGLPPNRRMCTFALQPCSLDPLPPAPLVHAPTHWRPVLGEVESVVQADPADKSARPGQWRSWQYELALVTQQVIDEDQSPERPPDASMPPTFELGGEPPKGKWRCASCYQTRFKTMCFGDNDGPAAVKGCRHCGKKAVDAGWTIWRTYADLPLPTRARIDRAFGPKVLAVLRTRWPGADLTAIGRDGAMATLGEAGFDGSLTPVPSV